MSIATIPIYFIVTSGISCFCLIWGMLRLKKWGLKVDEYFDLYLVIMISAFIGARLFHVFYENPEIYLHRPLHAFYFWEGGFVYYGGFITAALSGVYFLKIRKSKIQYLTYFDFFTPLISFSYSVGRLGCFFVGCCYGKYCSLPWAIEGRHPTQLYAFFWELTLCFILLIIEKNNFYSYGIKSEVKLKNFFSKPGSVFFLWLAFHSLGRILMELYRDDFRGPTFLISISSWISLFFIVFSVFILLNRLKHSLKST